MCPLRKPRKALRPGQCSPRRTCNPPPLGSPPPTRCWRGRPGTRCGSPRSSDSRRSFGRHPWPSQQTAGACRARIACTHRSHSSPCTCPPRTPRTQLRPVQYTRHCIGSLTRCRSRLLHKTARGTPRKCCCSPLSSTCPPRTPYTLQTHSQPCTCPDHTSGTGRREGRCSPRHNGTFARWSFGPGMWSLQGTSGSCRVR